MRIIRKSRLHYQKGQSDKVYEVDLVELDRFSDARYVVNFRYGRRGGRLRESTKTGIPLMLAAATEVFESVVVSKLNGGYVETADDGNTRFVEGAAAADSATDTPEAAANSDDPPSVRALLATLQDVISGRVDERVAMRALWRCGEIGIFDAGEMAARLSGRSSALLDHCIAWAIGRSANPAGTAALEGIWNTRGRTSAGLLAREALLDTAPEARILELQEAALGELPARLRDAVAEARREPMQAALADVLAQPTRQTPDALIDLYLLSRRNPELHAALLAIAADLEPRPNVFRGMRTVFKHAEYRLDGAMFGVLAARFEQASSGFYRSPYGGSHVRVRATGEHVRFEEEIRRDDAKIAFSNRTRDYLRRRVWRTLRRLGELDRDAYATMAAGVLAGIDDAAADEPRSVVRGEYRRSGLRYEYVRTGTDEYDGFASFLAFNHILRARSPVYALASGRNAWKKTGDDTGLPAGRTDAFPEIWDRHPAIVLSLLERSRNEIVHRFAVAVLTPRSEFLGTLELSKLIPLLASPYPATVEFAFELLRDRFDPAAPDPALLVAFLGAGPEHVRRFAQDWIDAHPTVPAREPVLLFAMITSPHPGVRSWARSVTPAHALDGEAAIALVGRLIAMLMGIPGLAHDPAAAATEPASESFDQSRIDDMGWALTDLFAANTRQLGLAVIHDLLDHEHPRVRLIGARLAMRSSERDSADTARLLTRLLHDSDGAVRTLGVHLLAELPDDALLVLSDMVASLVVAQAPEVRQAVQPIVARLCAKSESFADGLANDLISLLFRSESVDGLHEDILSLLEKSFTRQLQQVDSALVWRLLQARSRGAQALGEHLLGEPHRQEFSIRQIVRLASHPTAAVRAWARAALDDDEARIAEDFDPILKLLESPWDDSREFAFELARERFPAAYWTPDRIVAVCDSTREDVQLLGRELLARHYDGADGAHYLLRLAEHPAESVELFVTQLLSEQAAGEAATIEALVPYFNSVLGRVNRGRAAKQRVLRFLSEQAAGSPAIAHTVLQIVTRLSATALIGDRATYVAMIRDICARHPGLDAPHVVREPRRRPSRRPGLGGLAEAPAAER